MSGIALMQIPPRATSILKLNTNGQWQKRFLSVQDAKLYYAHSSTAMAKFTCNVEDILRVDKQNLKGKLGMSITIHQKTAEPKVLVFSSHDNGIINTWIYHLNKIINTIWTANFNDKHAKQVTQAVESEIEQELETEQESQFLQSKYAGILSRMTNSHAPTKRSYRDSQYSTSRSYGIIDPASDTSSTTEHDDFEFGSQVEYSENQSSCYHTTRQDSIYSMSSLAESLESRSSTGDHRESSIITTPWSMKKQSKALPNIPGELSADGIGMSEFGNSVHPNLWQELNRTMSESTKVLGCLNLLNAERTSTETTRTISTGLIQFAAFLLDVNKLSRSIASSSYVQGLDELTTDYYEFSRRLLLTIGQQSSTEQDSSIDWEREWEIQELKNIVHDIQGQMINILEQL